MEMNMNYSNALGEGYPPQAGVFHRMQYQSRPEADKQPSRRKRSQKQQTQQSPQHPFANTQRHDLDVTSKQQLELPQSPRQHLHHQQQGHMIPSQPQNTGQFGILAPTPMPIPSGAVGHASVQFAPPSHGPEIPMQSAGPAGTTNDNHGKLISRLVPDPPDLQAWREKLFNVDDTIVLTHDQFETYFPHVDNVYSHRSTQRYKRKPFVSHYWDCRMKGRPPGTPKTEDPSKKRRRRSTRERDLCDVKIKITEYFPGSEAYQLENGAAAAAAAGYQGQRFWTIQRVNGNGGNGKGDGVAGPHKHTLERSDEIKKNSVLRYMAQQDKDVKKTQNPARKASGAALATIKKHSKDNNLKFYAACYCPFSQRVWIALQAKNLAYQYCETDPYRRPISASLVEANPKGRVPALRQGDWACAESAVILEYLEDMYSQSPLLPSDPQLRANCRLWIDNINSSIIPAFYALLKNQDMTRQLEFTQLLQQSITSLTLAADEQGPFFLGPSLSLVDIHLAPFALRLRRILQPRRGWPSNTTPGSRWQRWLEALEQDPHVSSTTSADDLYAESADVLIKNQAPVPLSLV